MPQMVLSFLLVVSISTRVHLPSHSRPALNLDVCVVHGASAFCGERGFGHDGCSTIRLLTAHLLYVQN